MGYSIMGAQAIQEKRYISSCYLLSSRQWYLGQCMSHLGVERVTDMIRSQLFWQKVSIDIEQYVRNCGECDLRKTLCQQAASLHQIVNSGPMELVCINFLSMEPDSRGVSNVHNRSFYKIRSGFSH